MNTKAGSDIRPGDMLKTWFNGGEAQVKTVRPYVGPLLADLGEGTQIATFCGCPVEMTLCACSHYELA
ncbi:hypothetical protein [Burkholderia cepacia]|uniref:hypothetical protein n=1 Tax=Burkholderia cepacia TaxID=292 RepID=UPI001CF1C655|nr:hypothetical protein [Burkholderia cepacia]MCA8026514.1 hypothetical protein [Burkholderia cepacia]